MEYVKVAVLFVLLFLIVYFLYYFFLVKPQISLLKGKRKKELFVPTELSFLRNYYHVNIEKVGLLKVLRTLNFVNALFLSLLVISVYPIKIVYIKVLVIAVLMIPSIWFIYYFLAKYFKYIERKNE